MRWRDRYRDYERPKRPKARKLTKEEQQKLLATFTKEVTNRQFSLPFAAASRGRFTIDRLGDDGEPEERWGRITPLDDSEQHLLECEYREGTCLATKIPMTIVSFQKHIFRGRSHVKITRKLWSCHSPGTKRVTHCVTFNSTDALRCVLNYINLRI